MSLRDQIQARLQTGVTSLCETWNYARRTSGTATDPRTWGAVATILAHPTGEAASTEYDPDRAAFIRRQTMSLRIPDGQPTLSEGDLVQSPRGQSWEIDGITSRAQATGSVRYTLRRSKATRAEPERAGGGA